MDFASSLSAPYMVEAARLLLACVLGGMIGYEREHTNRPAGFRTHILVCAGSALVMLTGIHLFDVYGGHTDPARLGAQVVSGIGFIGAGTIIRDGFNVRGLTTAASLWAVSCVGLAAGSGYYRGAIAAAILICVTLTLLKAFESSLANVRNSSVTVTGSDASSILRGADDVCRKRGVQVVNIEFIDEGGGKTSAKFTVKTGKFDLPALVEDIKKVDAVDDVRVD